MTFGSLFAGIGGFDLGLERAGMIPMWQVEIDPFCLKVLEKHWPNVRRFKDVREVHGNVAHTQECRRKSQFHYGGGKEINVNHGLQVYDRTSGISVESQPSCPSCLAPVDLVCGGFPCQPFSVAGKQRGKEDDRHLWPEMFRIVSELRPTWVIGENVPGLVRLGLDQVLSDLEGIGYSVQTFAIPACAVDAPHVRERLWIVAHTELHGHDHSEQGFDEHGSEGPLGKEHEHGETVRDGEDVADADLAGSQGRDERGERTGERLAWPGMWSDEGEWFAESGMGRVANGVSKRVDRLRSLGNAVVPQVVEIIGRAILAVNK